MKKSLLAIMLYCLVAVCPATLPASAKTWEEAIADVATMAERFRRISRDKGFNEALGTGLNEVDVEMHLCAILGRMVGHKDSIVHLEPPQPTPGQSGRDFAIAAVSLENWVIAAKYHSGLDANSKRRIWNLDCVGQHGIPSALQVEGNRPIGTALPTCMEYRLC